MDENIKKLERERSLAILKSANQLLRESYEKVRAMTKDEVALAQLKEDFDRALEENLTLGRTQYNASEEEIERANYRTVDEKYVKEYQERLKKKHLTAEQLENKVLDDTIAIVTTSKTRQAMPKQRRKRLGNKKD